MTKNKLVGLVETLIMPALIAGIWYIYSNYLLFQNPDGSYSFTLSNQSMAVIATITVIILLIISFLIISHFNRSYNNRASIKTISDLAYDLSRLSLDSEFDKMVRRFGVDLGFVSIRISPEILAGCSLETLAGLIVVNLHKNDLQGLDFIKITESLAELIIKSWSTDEVDDFVDLVYERDVTIGNQLKRAVDYYRISQEIDEFQNSIERRLMEIDQRCNGNNTQIVNVINKRFNRFEYLTTGGSALKIWLSGFWSNFNWRKPAIIK